MVGKYQLYPEYKDSGVEWLADMPVGWFSLSLGKVVKFMNNGSSASQIEESEETVKVTRIETISGGVINLDKVGHVRRYDISTRFVLKKGDIQFSNINSLSMVGNCASFDENQELYAGMNLLHIRPESSRVYSKYMLYQFKTKWFRNRVEACAKPAINQASIPTGTLKHFDFLCPPLREQEKIANFLDHETAKIDTLIEKQQRLIKLLKEKRQAVISHAVTKGLNPNAPLRNSGVEWLGEVPEHWEVKQAKYIADITRGAILRPVDAPEYFDEEGEWAYLNISDATKCDKYLYKSKLYLSPLGSTKSARVYPDNVIITASATIGKAFINKIKVCIHDGFIPFCNLQVDKSYLYHYLSNPFLYAAMGKSNTQKNIYLDEVKNMVVTIPPDEEQLSIVEHIEKSAVIFDGLVGKAEKAIGLMQERRTALISAAVTGKIDVRHFTLENKREGHND